MNNPAVAISIPADGRYARLIRAVASSAAAQVLTVDGLEDLALAIDEACAQVLHVEDAANLAWTVTASDGRVEVTVRAIDGVTTVWPPTDWQQSLEAIVLTSVTSDVEVAVFDGSPGVRFSVSA